MAEEYDRRHADIWPALAERLVDAGVRSYHIYRDGELVFSHMAVDDFDLLVRRLDGDPVSLRWEREMADLIEYPDPDPDTGWPHRLQHVWSLKRPSTPAEEPT